jgi:hypothetical protein
LYSETRVPVSRGRESTIVDHRNNRAKKKEHRDPVKRYEGEVQMWCEQTLHTAG